MVGVDIVEHECDAVEILLALLLLLELLIEVTRRLLLLLLLLVLFILGVLPDGPEDHELLEEALDWDVPLGYIVREIVVEHLGEHVMRRPEHSLHVLLYRLETQILTRLDVSHCRQSRVLELVVTQVLKHWDNVLVVKVFWDLILDLGQLLVYCVIEHQRLRRLLLFSNLGDDP